MTWHPQTGRFGLEYTGLWHLAGQPWAHGRAPPSSASSLGCRRPWRKRPTRRLGQGCAHPRQPPVPLLLVLGILRPCPQWRSWTWACREGYTPLALLEALQRTCLHWFRVRRILGFVCRVTSVLQLMSAFRFE